MICLEQNLKGLCARYGIDFSNFLTDFGLDSVYELSLNDLESISQEYELDLQSLLFKPLFALNHLIDQIKKIKLLILDVDGVMTDGGMYYTENGDQLKKFNTKDGIGVFQMRERGLEIGIISSGFADKAIKKRAEILGIQRCYVGRDAKLSVLESWVEEMGISLDEVGMIGDDINDLVVMQKIGFKACPSDAVFEIKNQVDLILQTKGGRGCVREFVANHYLTIQN